MKTANTCYDFYDVTAIGELLIDFTPAGNSQRGDQLFARIPGGAPANVLAAAAKLGCRTAFIGKVGNDAFGRFLASTLEEAEIDAAGLVFSPYNTTLAFVTLDEKGDRSFSFYRKSGADMMLEFADVKKELVEKCRILHFGSVSLTDDPSRSATLETVRLARSMGKIISYDPNYRPLLWENAEDAVFWMREGLKLADIVKLSDEELQLLTGTDDPEAGTTRLAEEGKSLVFVSLGAKGAFYRCGSLSGLLPAYDVKTIDTNGAGDSFFGAIISRLKEKSLSSIRSLSKEELEDILSFGNAAGSLTTTKKGSIPALPTEEEIEACRKSAPFLHKE